MKILIRNNSCFRSLIIVLTMFLSISSFAQDTIITRDGRFIIGLIVEVSNTEVRYKKEGLADGPLYIEDKSTIDRIHYKNGFKDIFPEIKPWQLPIAKVEKKETPAIFKQKPALEKRGGMYLYDNERLSENELYRLLKSANDPDINNRIKMARRSKGLQYVGFAAMPLAMVAAFKYVVATNFYSSERNKVSQENQSKLLLGCAVISLGASCYFKINRKNRNADAVKLYQQRFN